MKVGLTEFYVGLRKGKSYVIIASLVPTPPALPFDDFVLVEIVV